MKNSKIRHRHIKNGFINGRSSPVLVIQLGTGNFSTSMIDGLKTSYIAYTNFVGGDIVLDEKNDPIYVDNVAMIPFFQTLHLTDYTQNLNVDWGSFKCKLNDQRIFFF